MGCAKLRNAVDKGAFNVYICQLRFRENEAVREANLIDK